MNRRHTHRTALAAFALASVLAGCGGGDEKKPPPAPTSEPPRIEAPAPGRDTARHAVSKPQVDQVKLGDTRAEVIRILGEPGRILPVEPQTKTSCIVYGAKFAGSNVVAEGQVWLICFQDGLASIVTNPVTSGA